MADMPGDPKADNYTQSEGLRDNSEAKRLHEQGAGFTQPTEAAEFGPGYDTGA